MKILVGDFKAKVGGENIFKPTVGHEIVQRDDIWFRALIPGLMHLGFKTGPLWYNRMVMVLE
jgi:hypothetical protein